MRAKAYSLWDKADVLTSVCHRETYTRGLRGHRVSAQHIQTHMNKWSHIYVKCLYFIYTYQDAFIQERLALMSHSAVDIHNEIHSGVFNLHATEAASLSEDCGNHFRGHCSLVWKITVRNSASRSKINTRASIHYFFFGGFFPPLSLFQWQNGGIIFHSMSELVFFPSHITPLERIWFLMGICVPSLSRCLPVSRRISLLYLPK